MPPQHWFTFPAKWRQREERSNSKRIRCHFFLLARENFIAAQPIRRTNHRDLGGETSSVWNFRSSCPRRHLTRKSLIALRNPLLFSQATDLDVGAFACNGSKIKLATVLSRQGRVRIRRYDSFCKLIVRSISTHATELHRKFASGTHSFQLLYMWQWTTEKKLTLELLWRGFFTRRQSTFVSSALTDCSPSCTLEQLTF